MKQIKKVLVLGSGALKIGEAGEFDYSGSQAIKALKEEGIKTILVNPNIATIQTSRFLADIVYFLPVNAFFVEKVIKKEKPDGILLSFGGQTALNCGLDLYKKGVFQKYHVKVLGTPVSAITLTEDRSKFAKHLTKIKAPIPQSGTAKTVKEAVSIARRIGFPLMIRSGYTLGGQGSGLARSEKKLREIVVNALSFAPHVLLEKYLYHYKEIEYEVVRDGFDNCITICNMENIDPMGIHTGESIVVAPSQTLTNVEYHTLRWEAIKIVRSLGIVGECNIQFALSPKPKKSLEYYVIEVNARLSRSSALASKATGYPLAYVAAKIALGKNLTSVKNKVTEITQSCFEPALDYVVVKIPRWDIEKFKGADEQIGSSMKSVGEVMGIGRTFEEALQKAVRMLDLDLEGVTSKKILKNGLSSEKTIRQRVGEPTPKRLFVIAQALAKKMSVSEIAKTTGIDPWFLYRIQNIVEQERKVKKNIKQLTSGQLWQLKRIGLSDKRIGELIGTTGLTIRKYRKKMGVVPSVFQIDTLAGEFAAKTNYLYLTYGGEHNDVEPSLQKAVLVLGSGPYRIGSSVEFDWTSVGTVLALQKHGKKSIIINCNPETVSTDYDIADKLYFEELTFERIADICEFEKPFGVIVSVGGQTPNNRAKALKAYGISILGTAPEDIERGENRSIFSKLLDELYISQPLWEKFSDIKDALLFSEKVGFPVLVRPSFVLSGTSMSICHTRDELTSYLKKVSYISEEYPITVSKFIQDAKEIEFDAVAQNGQIKASIISEHIENAGVHSGDATIVVPAQQVYAQTKRRIEFVSQNLAKALNISGPFNIQFLAKENDVSVIEMNLRASRTFPFISKVTGVDFIGLSVNAFLHKKTARQQTNSLKFVAVKVPQFSFARLTGADPVLRVEMASTGEVACFGEDVEEAFLKGELAVGGKIPKIGVFLSLGGDENKLKFLNAARMLDKLGLLIYSTEKTTHFLVKNGVRAKMLYKIHEKKSPNVLEHFQKGKVDLAINIVDAHIKKDIDDDYAIRRFAVDHNIPLFTNLKKAELFIKALLEKNLDKLLIKPWHDYAVAN